MAAPIEEFDEIEEFDDEPRPRSEFANATLDPGYFPGLERDARVAEMRREAAPAEIPLSTRIFSGLHSGIEQGAATPARLAHGALDLGLGATGLGDTRLAKWNEDMLRQYGAREADISQRDIQTFGENDIVNQLASGTGRAATELPLMLAPGVGAATPAQALARTALAGGAVGGGSSYAQDRGEGMDRGEAAAYAAISGTITALTTRAFGTTGVESIFRKEGIRGVRNRILDAARNSGMEMTEEGADQIQQDLLERAARNPDKPLEDSAKEVLMAAGVGGILGGGVTATRAAIDSIPDTGANPALSAAADEFNRRGVGIAGLPETQPIEEFDEPMEFQALNPATGSPISTVQPLLERADARMAQIDEQRLRETAKPEKPSGPNEITNTRKPSPTVKASPTMEFARQVSEMSPEDFFNKASAFNKVNLELGANASPDDIAELTRLRDKASKDWTDYMARLEQRRAAGETIPEAEMNRLQLIGGKPQFFNEAIAESKTKQKSPAKESASPQVATRAPESSSKIKNKLGDPLGTTYHATPEDWSAWQEMQGKPMMEGWPERERIKNKYGGMPPQPPVQESEIPSKIGEQIGAKFVKEIGLPSGKKWMFEDNETQGSFSVPAGSTPEFIAQKHAESKARFSETESDINTGALGEGGMGGAKLGEVATTGTTLKNASGELERVTSGLPPAFETQKRAMLPVWIESGELLAKDPQAGAKLAAELKLNPERGMTDTDSALLLRHKNALENAKNQAAEDTHTAKTPEAKLEAQNRFDEISNQMLDLLDAAKFRGAQWGREGRWRQAIAFEDFSLETMRRDTKIKADRPLTPEEEANIKRKYKEITDRQIKIDEATAKAEKEQREAGQKEAVDEAVKTGKARKAKDKAAGIVRDFEAEQRDAINFLKDHFIENGELLGADRSIRKLMELLVEREGITERIPLETRVHEILLGVDPTLTREATLDLMSGYGKSKLPSQEPAKKIVRDIAAQIISVRKLLDYFKGKQPSLTGMLRDAPSDIQRDLTRIVNLAKKNFKLDGPTDNPQAIKSAIDAINTRLKNRIKDVKQELATRRKILRERTPSPYNADTLKLRQELEALQAERDAMFGTGLTPAQQLERAEKSADNQIAELERQIKTGEIFPKSKVPFSGTSPQLEAAKAKIEELKLQRQFAREALQPRPEPEVARNEARVKSLDKQIQGIEKQLADDAVFSKPKKERTPSEDARILEREKRLAELKQERQFARERNQPGIEPNEAFLLNYLMRLSRREADYKERLAKGDFAKKAKADRELTPDILAAMAKVEKAKSDFRRGLAQYELDRRSRNQKIWDGIKATKNAFVNIVSSYDFSAPRQAFGAILGNVSRVITNPARGAKLLGTPFRDMFRAWASEETSSTIEQRIKNRPNALNGADKKAGIQYTDLHNPTFTKREENAQSILDDWAALPIKTGNALKTVATAIPKLAAKGVRKSNRAFVTYLNVTRAGLFDELLRANFSDHPPTDAELKVAGLTVNLATGRGDLSPGVAKVASEILWAPSLLASRIQILTGQPFWGKSGREGGSRARKLVAKEYARWIVSGAALYAISKLFDDDDDEITSSDAGKIVRGKTRIDPWAGFQQVVVLEARLATGETTSSTTGKTRDISGFGTGEVIWNFVKNKTRPDLVAAVKLAIAAIDSGKDSGVRVTPREAAASVVPVPLALREVIAVMRDRGMTEGAIVSALAVFGAGVSVYDDDAKAKERQK